MPVDETPTREPVPDHPMPPESLPGAMGMPPPTPFADLPKPGRRGDGGAAVPFDPMAFSSLNSLEEVQRKAPAAEGLITKAQVDAARRKQNFIPKFATLENMYAAYPLLKERGRLRVVREQPQWSEDQFGQKVRVCGTLDFKHPCIGSDQFAARFGGFKYRVFGMLDQENRENAGGPPQPVDVAVAEFDIPVSPNLQNLPVAEADMGSMENMPPFPMYDPQMFSSPYGRRPAAMPQYPPYFMPQQSQGDAMGAFANFATKVVERQQPASAPVSDAFWNVIGRNADTSVENMRLMADQQAAAYREQAQAAQRREEAAMQALRDQANRPADVVQMVSAMSQLVQAQKGGADSDTIRQLRDDHERQMRHASEENERAQARLREENDRTLTRLREDNERAIERERSLADNRTKLVEARIADLERTLERRERELRDEADKRESKAREEAARIMDSREREHAQRLTDLKEMHATAIANLSQMHDREVRMQEALRTNANQVAEQAHSIQLNSLQKDLAKQSGELAEKARLVEEHMAEKNKPLLEQVREIQETTAALQDIAGGGGDDKGDGEPVKWYNSELMKSLAPVIAPILLSKGGELATKLSSAIEDAKKNPPPTQQGPMQYAPQAMMPEPPGNRLPPRKTRKMSFADTDGPRLRERENAYANMPRPSVDPRDLGPKAGSPRPFYPDVPDGYAMPQAPAAPMQQQPMPSQPTQGAPSSMGPPAAPRKRPAAQAPEAPAPAEQAPAAEPEADEWIAFSWMPMARNDTIAFIQQLEQAVQAKVPPAALVQQFLGAYPLEIVEKVPVMIPIKRLVEAVRSSPATANMMLATGGGRRFLTDVWEELRKRIEEAKAAPASSQNESPDETEGENK